MSTVEVFCSVLWRSRQPRSRFVPVLQKFSDISIFQKCVKHPRGGTWDGPLRGGRLSPLGLGLGARRTCRCARQVGKAAQMRADGRSTCYSPARALGPGDAGARRPKHVHCRTSDARTGGASAAYSGVLLVRDLSFLFLSSYRSASLLRRALSLMP